jgi:hypothetical protein
LNGSEGNACYLIASIRLRVAWKVFFNFAVRKPTYPKGFFTVRLSALAGLPRLLFFYYDGLVSTALTPGATTSSAMLVARALTRLGDLL